MGNVVGSEVAESIAKETAESTAKEVAEHTASIGIKPSVRTSLGEKLIPKSDKFYDAPLIPESNLEQPLGQFPKPPSRLDYIQGKTSMTSDQVENAINQSYKEGRTQEYYKQFRTKGKNKMSRIQGARQSALEQAKAGKFKEAQQSAVDAIKDSAGFYQNEVVDPIVIQPAKSVTSKLPKLPGLPTLPSARKVGLGLGIAGATVAGGYGAGREIGNKLVP